MLKTYTLAKIAYEAYRNSTGYGDKAPEFDGLRQLIKDAWWEAAAAAANAEEAVGDSEVLGYLASTRCTVEVDDIDGAPSFEVTPDAEFSNPAYTGVGETLRDAVRNAMDVNFWPGQQGRTR